ncbi:unnamed protein product [Polarella glacialis]|uniref:Major facilitator superfamily (MFS) profile domain-containing protein n=1 Tax=Polarella glacialis TaxID=89957 RepID=A0A813JXC4_POLGL|nr:unnamed protein product [Polarella glacialis]
MNDDSPDSVRQFPLAVSDPVEYTRRVCALYASSGAAILGNVLEWYDWTVSGYMQDILRDVFLDGSQLGSWLVFAIPFGARPLGSVLLGWVGDRYGRKVALNAAIWGMALATVLQGCLLPALPGAVALLAILCFCSGLSAGGEAASVNTYMTEFGGRERDYTLLAAVGVNNVSGSLAFLAANVVVLLVHQLPRSQQLSYGWRIPFLLSAPVGLLSVLLRRGMPETEAFLSLKSQGGSDSRSPVDDGSDDRDGSSLGIGSGEQENPTATTTKNPTIDVTGRLETEAKARLCAPTCFADARAIVLTVIVISAINSCNYFPVYLASWLTSQAGFSANTALLITAISKVVQTLMTFPASFAGDRLGATRTMLVGGTAACVFMVPAMLLVIHVAGASVAETAAAHSESVRVVLVAALVLGVFLPVLISFYLVPSNLFMTSLFRTAFRGRGAGLGLGLASVVGGLTPLISAALAESGGDWLPGAFISGLAGPSLAALCWCRRAAACGRLAVHQRPWLF